MQLKITYSRHKDLNVKGNNDRGMDYTTTAGAVAPPLAASAPAYSQAAATPASSYQGVGADLLLGGGGAPVAQHEQPPTGNYPPYASRCSWAPCTFDI